MKKWIYPYDVLFGDVATRLLRVSIDGDPVPAHLVDNNRYEIQLVDADRSDWSSLELRIEVTAPVAEIEEMIDQGLSVTAIGVLHCGASNSRVSVPLTSDDNDPSRWIADVELERDAWFGRIAARGIVVANVGGVPNRIVGTAPEWSIRLDDMPVPPVQGAIKIKWDDFTDPQHFPGVREYEKEPAFLHVDPGEPVLYLNRAFEGLAPLLDDRKRRNPSERALHDQARATIAAEAWSTMFNASLSAIQLGEEVGDPVDWPESEWQSTAVKMVAGLIYPDKDPEDALAELAQARSEPVAANALQERMLPAISGQVGVPRLMRGAIQQVGTGTWTAEVEQ